MFLHYLHSLRRSQDVVTSTSPNLLKNKGKNDYEPLGPSLASHHADARTRATCRCTYCEEESTGKHLLKLVISSASTGSVQDGLLNMQASSMCLSLFFTEFASVRFHGYFFQLSTACLLIPAVAQEHNCRCV